MSYDVPALPIHVRTQLKPEGKTLCGLEVKPLEILTQALEYFVLADRKPTRGRYCVECFGKATGAIPIEVEK